MHSEDTASSNAIREESIHVTTTLKQRWRLATAAAEARSSCKLGGAVSDLTGLCVRACSLQRARTAGVDKRTMN